MIYDPEARTLNILTTVTSTALGSSDAHCISAYPDYDTSTVDAAFYISRRETNNKLAGLTIQYTT